MMTPEQHAERVAEYRDPRADGVVRVAPAACDGEHRRETPADRRVDCEVSAVT
jgi:hypothetical protein